MEAFCRVCDDHRPASFRNGTDPHSGEEYEDLCCDECHFVIATVTGRESAAEKNVVDSLAAILKGRDEAIAWGEKLKEALQECASKLESQIARNPSLPLHYRDVVKNAFDILAAEDTAALSHLRQEIRREALEEAAKACEAEYTGKKHDFALGYDEATEDCAAAIRRLAEEAKEQEGKK